MQQDNSTDEGGKLAELTAIEQREVMHRWRQQSGMAGPRSGPPDTPHDPVAFKLLDAAGDAIGRGELRQGLAILKLIASHYRRSHEAACARLALDRLTGKAGEHGR